MKTNIALIGFMGAGKTAVGKVLARKLNRKFIEMDSLIERKAGKSIPVIFREDGEIAFRELEIEVTREISGEKCAVIACGGGLVLNRINIDRLRAGAVMVYLTASPNVVLKRTAIGKNERPLLDVSDQASRIKELMKFRRPFYERAADVTVNTSRLSVETVAEAILEKLKADESFDWPK